jgi:hypothetical protein
VNDGADASLLVSPSKVKDSCELELPSVLLLLLLALGPEPELALLARSNLHGTATNFSPLELLLAVLLGDVLAVLLGVVLAVLLGVVLAVLLGVVLAVLLGVVLAVLLREVLEEALEELCFSRALELSEITAKSIRPEPELITQSLIVPSSWPELPFTWAPVSWLARASKWPMPP